MKQPPQNKSYNIGFMIRNADAELCMYACELWGLLSSDIGFCMTGCVAGLYVTQESAYGTIPFGVFH